MIMKTTIIILLFLIVAILVRLFFYGLSSQKGVSPGLVDGQLRECSSKPNCVCSEIIDDLQHYVEPIKIPQENIRHSLEVLNNIIQGMGGVLHNKTEHYFAYSFSSTIFSFVDDFEIRFDAKNNVVQLRSASRVGTSDFGVNSKRVKLLKRLYSEKVSNDNY